MESLYLVKLNINAAAVEEIGIFSKYLFGSLENCPLYNKISIFSNKENQLKVRLHWIRNTQLQTTTEVSILTVE